MPASKRLTKTQLAVIDELFAGRLEEHEILDKYKLTRKLYHKWWNDHAFKQQFDKRIADAYRQSAVLIARYAPVAAAKLIQLTESDRPETARKACLDIISMHTSSAETASRKPDQTQPADTKPSMPFTPETAGKLLAVLAEDNSINKP
jgi:hypothetical protein